MRKVFAVLAFGLLASALTSAEVKTVPSEVLTWYKDAMVLYGDLVKALDKAQTAKATAAAYKAATGAVESKKLVARYKALKKTYPRFFDDTGDEDTAWVPPADWLKTLEDYSKTMETYGEGMQKAMVHYQDPAVQKELQAFSEAWDTINSDD